MTLDARAVARPLGAPRQRPTPQSTVEAIVYSVRMRGLAALNEPATRERLARCDDTAYRHLEERITRMRIGGAKCRN